jgi:hypothetical protein
VGILESVKGNVTSYGIGVGVGWFERDMISLRFWSGLVFSASSRQGSWCGLVVL